MPWKISGTRVQTAETLLHCKALVGVKTLDISACNKALLTERFTRGETQVSSSGIVALSARQPAAAQVGNIHTHESRSRSMAGFWTAPSSMFDNMHCSISADPATMVVIVPAKSRSILTSNYDNEHQQTNQLASSCYPARY